MKFVFPYIALLFFAFSCNKSDDPCQGEYNHTYTAISSSLDSYKFKENSYWVYQNDVTAQIDSQRVVSASTGQIGSGGGSSCGSAYAETYQMHVACSFNNQNFDYNMMGVYLSKKTFVPGTYEVYIFNNTNSFTSDNNIQLLEIIPSMNLNGNTIQHVKKFRTDSAPHDVIYYFANAIGVVKWEIIQGTNILESWSIKSWEVVL